MFVPCWKEIKQLAGLVSNGVGAMGAVDKEGVLQLRLTSGNYRQNIQLRVPAMYPEEGVEIEFQYSNYPTDIQYIFKSQAEEIVRRCLAGYSPEAALQSSNPIKDPATVKKTESSAPKLSAGSLKSMKHDVAVLKQISDLREVSTSKDKRNQSSSFSTMEKKEARKDLRRLAKAETAADEEQERLRKEEEQAEMLRLMGTKVSGTAQPSLYAVARFLVEDYVLRLPQEKCQACNLSVLPADPADDAVTNPQSSKRPMRTFCGHWLHFSCLDEWLTTPPFIRKCPVCERRIWHPDWPSDVKALERTWQNKQMKAREMSDVRFCSCSSYELIIIICVTALLIYLFIYYCPFAMLCLCVCMCVFICLCLCISLLSSSGV